MKKQTGRTSFLCVVRRFSTTVQASIEATSSRTPHHNRDSSIQKIPKRPNGHWAKHYNQRSLIEQVAQKLGIADLADWYTVRRKQVLLQEPAAKIIFKYYASLPDALRTLYPDYPWQPLRFVENDIMRPRYWSGVGDLTQFVEEIGKSLGIREMSDWYNVRKQDLIQRGGNALLRLNDSSIEKMLRTVYPDYPWESEKFNTRAPRKYWLNTSNILSELSKAEQQLGIKQPEDWYSVTLADLKEIGISKRVTKPMLADLLAQKYPHYEWNKVILLKGRFAHQKRLEKAVASLFPDIAIETNVRKEANLIHPETNNFMELDIFIPSLNLAFEYQEQHHYKSTQYMYKPLEEIQARDRVKKALAGAEGITLITVPFWWDGKIESLVATIKHFRPDLLVDNESQTEPIPKEMPLEHSLQNLEQIEDIGQPTTACFLAISNVNPVGWWMFEKYDGVRGFWNPIKKTFYSRRGNVLTFPPHVVDTMPNVFLDGEIWFGRDNFEESMKIVHRMDDSQLDWNRFKYMVFDLPKCEGTYSERYKSLAEQVQSWNCKYINLAEYVECKDMAHLETFYQDIVDKGGEGVILRDPECLLQPGRSPGYLKHKKFRDGEAKIIGNVGIHQWECELPNGVRFVAAAGTTEFTKRWTPQNGDIVSFKHRGYLEATKKPKLPTLFRMRPDLTWEDVVKNWKEKKSTPKAFPLRRTEKHKAKGYWRDPNNTREFFLNFAKTMGFDPTDTDAWNRVSIEQITEHKGRGLLAHYRRLPNALKVAFPAMNVIERKKQNGYWDRIENRKRFFIDIASEFNFDPYNLENWTQKVSYTQIAHKKGLSSILSKYNGLADALQNTFLWHTPANKPTL